MRNERPPPKEEDRTGEAETSFVDDEVNEELAQDQQEAEQEDDLEDDIIDPTRVREELNEAFKEEIAKEKRATFSKVFRTPIRNTDNPTLFERTEFGSNRKTGNQQRISYSGKKIFKVTGGRNRSRYANETLVQKDLIEEFNIEFQKAKTSYESSAAEDVEEAAEIPLPQETVDDVNINVTRQK